MARVKPWEGVWRLEGPEGRSTVMNLQADQKHQSKALHRAHVKHDLCIFRGSKVQAQSRGLKLLLNLSRVDSLARVES